MWEEKGELQFERPREVFRSLIWSWKQFLLGRMQYMTWSVTTPMPGAPLFDIVKRHGLDQTEDVLNHWDSNKDYLGIDLSSLGVAEWKKMWLLRAGILTKACFMMVSGQFDWRRHFFRVGILMRSFTGRWRVKRARKNNDGPLFGGTPLRTKVEG